MTEKFYPSTFVSIPVEITNSQWEELETSGRVRFSQERRIQINDAISDYVANRIGHQEAARPKEILPKLKNIHDSSGKLLEEMADFFDFNARDEEVMKVIGLIRERKIETDTAYLSTDGYKNDRRIGDIVSELLIYKAKSKITGEINLYNIFHEVKFLYDCTTMAIEEMPCDYGRDGDPFMPELLARLFTIYHLSGGRGYYGKTGAKPYIEGAMTLVASVVKSQVGVDPAREILHGGWENLKDRIKKARGEKSLWKDVNLNPMKSARWTE